MKTPRAQMKPAAALSLFLSLAAFADETSKGPSAILADPINYPSVCKVEVVHVDKKMMNLCTGTLIGPTTVVTAAHCFHKTFDPKLQTVYATCAGVRQEVISSLVPKEGWVADDNLEYGKDAATITVKTPFVAPPIPVMTLQEATRAFDAKTHNLKPEFSCLNAGYGVNEKGEVGEFHVWKVKDLLFRFVDSMVVLTDPVTNVLKTTVTHGDSGGPLICTDAKGVSRLVGITASFSHRVEGGVDTLLYDNFTPAWSLEVLK